MCLRGPWHRGDLPTGSRDQKAPKHPTFVRAEVFNELLETYLICFAHRMALRLSGKPTQVRSLNAPNAPKFPSVGLVEKRCAAHANSARK